MWCFQVEVTGLNTVLVQNLSSLSRYLVSVQSHYPQGLSAALTGNITTRKALKKVSSSGASLGYSEQVALPCSQGASAFGPEGDELLGRRHHRALGARCCRCRVLPHQMDFSERRSPQTGDPGRSSDIRRPRQ